MAVVKQLASKKTATKSKSLSDAAKRKLAEKKKKAVKGTKPKVAAPVVDAAPTEIAVNPQSAISSPTGSLISPETWQADQTRLQSAAEDADTVDELNAQESGADLEYETSVAAARKAAALKKLEISKQRDEFNRIKPQNDSRLNNVMAYRGASRSSAFARGRAAIDTLNTNTENQFKTGETDATTYLTDAENAATTAREATKGYILKRRGTLATRAASRGVYSPGAGGSDESGIKAPGINAPANAATAAKATAATKAKGYKGKYPGPDKYKGDQKKIAAAKAAKRRIAAKKGK